MPSIFPQSPPLDTDWYGRVGVNASNGNLENYYQGLVSEQRALNQLQMEREDSAYQRMVADMKKAGLNPWTGISTGGLSTSQIASPHKSALSGLVQLLDVHNNAISGANRDTLGAVNTGAKIALGIIGGLFGL